MIKVKCKEWQFSQIYYTCCFGICGCHREDKQAMSFVYVVKNTIKDQCERNNVKWHDIFMDTFQAWKWITYIGRAVLMYWYHKLITHYHGCICDRDL